MKVLVLASFLAVFVFVVHGSAQSVVITPKKITYTRPKPIVDFKKTFTVRYPKVKASTPAVSKKIESTLSYAKVLGLNIRDEISDIQWLEEADYEVGYNAKGLLTITLSMNGTAAYPSGTEKTLVVDLRSGNRVRPIDVFTNLNGLAAMVRKTQRSEVLKSTKEIGEDPESRDVDPKQLFEGTHFTTKDLNEFAVNETGVTFIYDYGFVHAVQALQPEGRYSYTWTQLKPFIKRGGLLARFVRPILLQ